MREETKKIFSASEIGVLVEDFDKKLDVVAEGVLTLDRKVNTFSERMGRIEDRLDKIDAEIVEIKAILSVKTDLGRFEELERRIARLEAEQKELRSRIGAAS